MRVVQVLHIEAEKNHPKTVSFPFDAFMFYNSGKGKM